MKERISNLIKTLEGRYTSPGETARFMLSANGSRRYELHPLKKENFISYSPYDAEKNFMVAAADSGSLLIYETPTWSLGYYKLSFRLFDVSRVGKTCNTVEAVRERREDFVLVLKGEGLDAENVVHRLGNEDAEAALNRFRAEREVEFVTEQLNGMNPQDLLLVDGSLENENSSILKKHKNTIGLSKRTGLSINGYSATSFFALKVAESSVEGKPWFYHPLVKSSPADLGNTSDIVFGSLRPNSVVFRLDFPSGSTTEHITTRMRQIGLCSLDAKYRSYPYPLGAVHSDSVMRKNTKELTRQFIKRELNKYKADGAEDVYALIEKDILHADWYDNLRKYS